MNAGKRTINEIFNQNKILEIPFFQRAYVWDVPQWERFINDMEEVSYTNKPYFLGSVILKQQPTDSHTSIGDKRTVIDGQQRLTTLNLFFKVLSLQTNNQFLAQVFRLPLNNNQIALQHNHNDIEAFDWVMNLEELVDTDKEDNISRAYQYFKDNIEDKSLNFQNILTNVMFVGIDLSENEDEQQIFDTINSLGVRLTTAELLKNHFFNGRDNETYLSYKSNWKDIFENDQDAKEFWDKEITAGRFKRDNIDLFFYSFLQIKIQDPKLAINTKDKYIFSKVDGLFESYKKFISDYYNDKPQLITEIREYAEIYQKNIDYSCIERETPQDYGIDRINTIIFGLENTTMIPYVLYVLKEVDDDQERNSIFEYLESFVMRRMVCHESTKNYNQLFSEQLIGNKIKTKEALINYIDSRGDKVNHMPTDESLLYGFQNSRLINKQTAGILYLIESKIRNRAKHSTSLLGLDQYSLEHIMPKKWENHWDKLKNEEDKIYRNRKLLSLGNLTIITSSLNTSIRDAAWSTKKKGKNGKRGLRHFASGFETFSQYLDETKWDEERIEHRAKFLFKQAKNIWKQEKVHISDKAEA